jgi:hypothetical protein
MDAQQSFANSNPLVAGGRDRQLGKEMLVLSVESLPSALALSQGLLQPRCTTAGENFPNTQRSLDLDGN